VDSFSWRRGVRAFSLLQYAVFVIVVAVLVKPLGGYMARVFDGEKTVLDPVLRPMERLIYRLSRVEPKLEMDWAQYSIAFIVFGLVGTLVTLRHSKAATIPAFLLCQISNNSPEPGPGNEHCDQLRHHDYLAGLRR